jgi:signal peptidase I
MKKLLIRIAEWLSYAILILFGVVVLYYLVRIFVIDSFPVNTTSMSPTIQPGDRIMVNKLIFGGRIYKSFDFSPGKPLESWRMPRWREIRHNDVVVFNHVRNKELNRIRFNFGVIFVKRCVGLPGDTLTIVDGFYRNTSAPGVELGIREQQMRLNSPDTLPINSSAKKALKYTRPQHNWTIFNLGPLYIPQKGSTVALDSINYAVYRLAIEFETDRLLTCQYGRIFLDNRELHEYTFQKNYYFMAGDNVIDSNDSRYWGYVPEEFIIGVVPRLLSSRYPSSGKVRWQRVLKKL